jgi:hypothetical protein
VHDGVRRIVECRTFVVVVTRTRLTAPAAPAAPVTRLRTVLVIVVAVVGVFGVFVVGVVRFGRVRLALFLGPLFGRAVAAGLPLVVGLVVGSALFAAATPATPAATTAPPVGGPIRLLLSSSPVSIGCGATNSGM